MGFSGWVARSELNPDRFESRFDDRSCKLPRRLLSHQTALRIIHSKLRITRLDLVISREHAKQPDDRQPAT